MGPSSIQVCEVYSSHEAVNCVRVYGIVDLSTLCSEYSYMYAAGDPERVVG